MAGALLTCCSERIESMIGLVSESGWKGTAPETDIGIGKRENLPARSGLVVYEATPLMPADWRRRSSSIRRF